MSECYYCGKKADQKKDGVYLCREHYYAHYDVKNKHSTGGAGIG